METGLEFFAGQQRSGIGRFRYRPDRQAWWWDDVVFAILGYPVAEVEPSWSLILSHVPAEEQKPVRAAFAAANRRPGAFTWSHRVVAADKVIRSVLVVGDSRQGFDPGMADPAAPNGVHAPANTPSSSLLLSGFIVDLTELRASAARSAGTDAVQRSNAHRTVIEQAKGVLMLAYHLDADAAFALLAWHSQQTNRKVYAIAAGVVAAVATDGLPDTPVRNALDRILAAAPEPRDRHRVATQ